MKKKKTNAPITGAKTHQKHNVASSKKISLTLFDYMMLFAAKEYAESIIVDFENHSDAVRSTMCDFMEGAKWAMEYNK